ncbi:hypothetical protein M885DRAFT_51893 [Pelagophyceae sp. CCMP2097]|nr:hypothetical protein M885DRAFT_51893 [Pelagophyceae sp. CCMP2097]
MVGRGLSAAAGLSRGARRLHLSAFRGSRRPHALGAAEKRRGHEAGEPRPPANAAARGGRVRVALDRARCGLARAQPLRASFRARRAARLLATREHRHRAANVEGGSAWRLPISPARKRASAPLFPGARGRRRRRRAAVGVARPDSVPLRLRRRRPLDRGRRGAPDGAPNKDGSAGAPARAPGARGRRKGASARAIQNSAPTTSSTRTTAILRRERPTPDRGRTAPRAPQDGAAGGSDAHPTRAATAASAARAADAARSAAMCISSGRALFATFIGSSATWFVGRGTRSGKRPKCSAWGTPARAHPRADSEDARPSRRHTRSRGPSWAVRAVR